MNARLLTLADSKIGRKRKLVWAAFCCPPFLSPRALMRRKKWHMQEAEAELGLVLVVEGQSLQQEQNLHHARKELRKQSGPIRVD